MKTLILEIKHTGIMSDQQLVDLFGNAIEMLAEDVYESIKILPASQSPIPAEVIEQIRGLKWNDVSGTVKSIRNGTIDDILSILESHQPQETCKWKTTGNLIQTGCLKNHFVDLVKRVETIQPVKYCPFCGKKIERI
jgi:hypothetical protein